MDKNRTTTNRIKESPARVAFTVGNTIFLILLSILMIIPFLKVIAESLSAKEFVDAGFVLFWPKGFTLESYKLVFNDPEMLRAFGNTMFITVVGTAINLIMTALLAYPVSRPEFGHKKFVLLMVTITMIFGAPMIPNYLLAVKLHLDNTLWAVIVPTAISGFNFFILRTFFLSIPSELIEAARIDGCSELKTLFRIVLPISKPAFATLGLFYGVSHWNDLSGSLIYLRSPAVKTLQLKLYELIMLDSNDIPGAIQSAFSAETLRMTSILVATLPILMVYPFLQKYFVKGANLGAVKA